MVMCPECQVNLPSEARRCPLCGWNVPAGGAPPQDQPHAQAGPCCGAAAASSKRMAWEDPARGRWSRWWATAQESIFHPDRFYRALPASGSLSAAYNYAYFNKLIFLVPILGIMTLVLGGAAAVVAVAAPDTRVPVCAILGGSALATLTVPFLVYVFGWPFSFVGAFILHVCGKIFGARGTFRGTYRMAAYASATNVVTVLASFIGMGWVGTIWHYVLLYFGYKHVHSMSTARAIGAVVLPVVVFVVVPILLVIGTYVGVAISVAAANNVPEPVKKELSATATEFGQAWMAGDREALRGFLVDLPKKTVDQQLDELLAQPVEKFELGQSVRRRVIFDPKICIPGVGRGQTYVLQATATQGGKTCMVNLAVAKLDGRWVLARLWKSG